MQYLTAGLCLPVAALRLPAGSCQLLPCGRVEESLAREAYIVVSGKLSAAEPGVLIGSGVCHDVLHALLTWKKTLQFCVMVKGACLNGGAVHIFQTLHA